MDVTKNIRERMLVVLSEYKGISKKMLLLSLIIMLIPFFGLNHVFSEENNLSINPSPQILNELGEGFWLANEVGLVIGENTDEFAVREVEQILESAGVERIVRENAGEPTPDTPVTIWIGGQSENQDSPAVLQQLGLEGAEDLKEEGYVLASEQNEEKKIVLAGKDKTGTYYAARTLGEIIQEKQGSSWVPSVEIRDWPEMPLRGSIEGFYGPPWTHEDRLNQIEFYGDNKMNTYIYAPKDDPYHRDQWREPYPEEELNELKELIDTSQENHVDFTFSLSPGNSICYSDNEDFDLLMDKMDDMWDLGVRSYAVFLDDIPYELHCEQDEEAFEDDPNPVAAAHAFFLNRFKEEFLDNKEDAARLITVPTDYAGMASSAYRDRFAEVLDDDVIVMWTGPDVVPEEITAEQAKEAWESFQQHDLFLWDNFPVNDIDRNRLFLGPLVNRDADLIDNGVIGLASNPMNEAEASKIPLYTIADYAWNPYAYNAEDSWGRSIESFGGNAADSLKTFAENSYSTQLNEHESLTLTPLIDDFWKAYESDNVSQEGEQLKNEFENLQIAVGNLRANLDNEQFLNEVDPYLTKLSLYGQAGVTAVNLLMADETEEAEYRANLLAQIDQLDEIPQKMGESVIDSFLTQAIYGEYVHARKLDGVNSVRGAGNLIKYTPEHRDTTRTNEYGYEVVVEDGIIVEKGGNNSRIPDNGYVLSIHGSNWLFENALIGEEVSIEYGYVFITGEYITQPDSVNDIKVLIEQYDEKGMFDDDETIRHLQTHLTSVSQYEDQEETGKVIQHLEGFKHLLGYQLDEELIAEEVYESLIMQADALISKLQ
jgi:hyaluronoglucosaminidase